MYSELYFKTFPYQNMIQKKVNCCIFQSKDREMVVFRLRLIGID